MSDMDDGGVCPECRQRKEGLPCYNEASTTERRWDRGGQDAHKVESSAESSARGCIAVQGLGKYAQEGRNCYGRLAVVSDVDDGGSALNVDKEL
jgi:hypothetical protein